MLTFSQTGLKGLLSKVVLPIRCRFAAIFFKKIPAMAKTTRLIKSLSRLLLPAVLLVVAAVVAGSVTLVYMSSRPLKAQYLVTPQKYGQLSTRAAQVTEETWAGRDGGSTRGWLLRGLRRVPLRILLPGGDHVPWPGEQHRQR